MYTKTDKKYWLYLLLGLSFCFHPNTLIADSFERRADYNVYFTPQDNCTFQITKAIDSARTSIYMQAYSLTSKPIVESLIKAHQRKVSVNIIIDKSNLLGNSQAKFLAKQGISVWVDNLSGLSHNKVIVVDQKTTITGSFNFSYSAQHRNRENVLIVKDKTLTKLYLENWLHCQKKSTLLKYKQFKSQSTSTVQQTVNTKRIFIGLSAFVAISSILIWNK